MFYLGLISLIFLPLLLKFYDIVTKRKIQTFQFLLGFIFAPLALIISPLTITRIATPLTVIIMFSLIIIGVILFYVYWFIKSIKLKNILWNNVIKETFFNWENIIYFSSVFLLIIFLIFSKYSDHDAAYYINISSYFSNGTYSTDGINLNQSKYYLSPLMYYIIGSVFSNDIFLTYKIINPITIFVICYSLMSYMLSYNNWTKKIKLLLSLIISISLVFLLLAQLNYLIGMNLVMQSLIIVVVFCLVKYEKSNWLINYLSLFGFSFFSSTGLITGIIIVCSMSLYYILRYSWKKTLMFMPSVLMMLILCIFVFTSVNIFIINFYSIFFILSIYILFSIQLLLISCKEWKFNDMDFLKTFWQKKYFKYITIFLFSCFSIFQLLFFSLIYNLEYTIWQLVFITFILNVSIIAIMIYLGIKSKNIDGFTFFIFITEIFGLLVLIFQKFIPQFSYSSSAWRAIYVNFGMGNLTDIILCLLFFVNIGLTNISFNNTMIKKVISCSRIFILLLTLLISLFSMLNIYTNIFNYSNNNNNIPVKMKSNVLMNIYGVTSNDIKLLDGINVGNYSITYMSDIQLSPMLRHLVDATQYLASYEKNGKLIIQDSYKWNFNNWLNGINDWNSKETLQIGTTPIEISDLLKKSITNFPNQKILNIYGKNLDKINYVILRKDTIYYNDCKNTLTTIGYNKYDGDSISIFKAQ